MIRTTCSVQQGTPEWHALRARYFTASEAAAMMGCSPYESRAALLRRKATGAEEEPDAARIRLFERGHAAEASARVDAEKDIGDELYPAVMTLDVEGLPLLASLDGLTMDGSVAWEHKLISDRILNALIETGEPPLDHIWQMEHQLLVSGAGAVHYWASNGCTPYSVRVYSGDKERRAALIAGWKQFAADLSAYRERPPDPPKAEGKPVAGFGTLVLRVEGRVLASNMDAFRAGAQAFLARLPKADELRDDQDFADAESAVKACSEAESRIKAAKEQAIAQMADVELVLRTADDVTESIRAARLSLDKVVKARKEALRGELVAEATRRVRDHYAALASELGDYAPGIPAALSSDIGSSIKGLKSLDSLRDRLDQAVANAKIAAEELASRIRANKALIEAAIAEHGNLWPDGPRLAQAMDAEAVIGAISARVAERQRHESEKSSVERKAKDAEDNTRQASTAFKLKNINAMLYPLYVTIEALSALGFEPNGFDGASVLYAADRFPLMCDAIAKHAASVGRSYAKNNPNE